MDVSSTEPSAQCGVNTFFMGKNLSSYLYSNYPCNLIYTGHTFTRNLNKYLQQLTKNKALPLHVCSHYMNKNNMNRL